eukprot:CAMPEP_0198198876 /NCGR_PEP_ID=MMETSP1445-20131203/2240_1 /TAXON_ID=36898 /ORGANISM="Pyramimonas sp., Strain CCMP2087" /LENGTH=352 /DNA_ID=CAMNT_0043868541 /DNA_START=228 /DNA_END=1286 /DNA_ORIENTATION=+
MPRVCLSKRFKGVKSTRSYNVAPLRTKRVVAPSASMRARFAVDVKFGQKEEALHHIAKWASEVGCSDGISEKDVRLLLGHIGFGQGSRVELEFDVAEGSLEGFLRTVGGLRQSAWERRLAPYVLETGERPGWQLYHLEPHNIQPSLATQADTANAAPTSAPSAAARPFVAAQSSDETKTASLNELGFIRTGVQKQALGTLTLEGAGGNGSKGKWNPYLSQITDTTSAQAPTSTSAQAPLGGGLAMLTDPDEIARILGQDVELEMQIQQKQAQGRRRNNVQGEVTIRMGSAPANVSTPEPKPGTESTGLTKEAEEQDRRWEEIKATLKPGQRLARDWLGDPMIINPGDKGLGF